MTIEPWADPELSAQLPHLCAAGESQSLEFKSQLPQRVKDLAKEIAALASTNGGLIVVGVNDDGSVCGVVDAHSADARDTLCRRIVGICQVVEPPVRPRLSWAKSGELGVLFIAVEKGSEPMYYVEQRPYVRHASVSRPATPAEVTAAIASVARTTEEAPAAHAELSTLADVLSSVLVWCDADSEMRNLKPWVDEWMMVAEYSAAALRELAATEWATGGCRAARLDELSDKLDEVAGFHHVLGGGASFDGECAEVRKDAADLIQELIWPVPLGDENQDAIRDAVIANSRSLASLWARAEKDVFDGRVEKAQQSASAIGKRMASWCYYKLTIVSEDARDDLRRISLQLFELAAKRTYLDGGESLRRIVRQGIALSDELTNFVQRFLAPAL